MHGSFKSSTMEGIDCLAYVDISFGFCLVLFRQNVCKIIVDVSLRLVKHL